MSVGFSIWWQARWWNLGLHGCSGRGPDFVAFRVILEWRRWCLRWLSLWWMDLNDGISEWIHLWSC